MLKTGAKRLNYPVQWFVIRDKVHSTCYYHYGGAEYVELSLYTYIIIINNKNSYDDNDDDSCQTHRKINNVRARAPLQFLTLINNYYYYY